MVVFLLSAGANEVCVFVSFAGGGVGEGGGAQGRYLTAG